MYIPYIIIKQIIKRYCTKNIFHHINVVTKPPITLTIDFVVIVNIGHIYVKYFHYGPILSTVSLPTQRHIKKCNYIRVLTSFYKQQTQQNKP